MRNNERHLRTVAEFRADGEQYHITGYASTFEKYVLYEDGPYTIYEQVDPHAFDGADMTDAVFRIDHEGKVYARSSAGTLRLDVDDHGLHFDADLSRTEAGRELWEEIRAGNYPQASYCYRIAEVATDEETRTRKVTRISKIYDVSPCAFPANPTTEVQARSYLSGETEGRELAERLARAKKAKRLYIRLSLLKD